MFRQEDAVKYFREHEGVIAHMYLDVVGLVTIGVGFMLPSPVAAETLKLIRRDSGAPATKEEKRRDWESVRAEAKAKRASTYRKCTQLDLPEAEIDRRLAELLEDFARSLRGRFPKFDRFPDTAQIGLLDMIYSLGPRGLFVGFPKFCAAVDQQDWRACARESKRRNVSERRNADLKQLFLDAAKPKPRTKVRRATRNPAPRGSS
jgi:GH24 family phage-related lysozyme (muramidase)